MNDVAAGVVDRRTGTTAVVGEEVTVTKRIDAPIDYRCSEPGNGVPSTGKRSGVERASWAGEAHRYAIFDVDPGDTTITYKFFQIPTVANGQTISLPTTPFDTQIFGRRVPVGRVYHRR